MVRKKKHNLIYGTEIFYTKKGLNDFRKKLKQMGMNYSTRKTSLGFYQIQWYKKKL